MSAKYYRDVGGKYLGAFVDGATPPAGAIEVAAPPEHGDQRFINNAWAALPTDHPARQPVVSLPKLLAALLSKGVLTMDDLK